MGYTHSEILGYLDDILETANRSMSVMLECFWGWTTLFKEVEDQTARHRREEKFAGRNSLGLLKIETTERIKAIAENQQCYKMLG